MSTFSFRPKPNPPFDKKQTAAAPLAAAGQLDWFEPARLRLWQEKNPQRCLKGLESASQGKTLGPLSRLVKAETTGYALMALKDYDRASAQFASLELWYPAGYAQLLGGKLEATRQYWLKLLTLQPTHWAICLFGLVTRQPAQPPTFLQVRNYLEADLYHLITTGQAQLANNVLSHLDWLAQWNPEAYKLAGRALMHAGWLAQAGPLLLKAQATYPHDPEAYFHLAQFYCGQLDAAATVKLPGNPTVQKGPAILMLKQCLLMNPQYGPARELLEAIV